jgi:hypothetical protein
MEVTTDLVDFPIKVEPVEFECEETANSVETEAEMYERHGQLHDSIIIVSNKLNVAQYAVMVIYYVQ